MHARMVGWAPHGRSLGSCSMQKELYLIRCLRRRLHLRARSLIKALLNSMTAPAQAAVDQERVLTRPRGERKDKGPEQGAPADSQRKRDPRFQCCVRPRDYGIRCGHGFGCHCWAGHRTLMPVWRLQAQRVWSCPWGSQSRDAMRSGGQPVERAVEEAGERQV